MERHLRPTIILDFNDSSIQALVSEQGWRSLEYRDRIGAVYNFVRELPFGYNTSDELPASSVLADGYGQCNTKTSLLMALLRAVDIPCRFHGATIHKRLQKGVVKGIAYSLAPENILHSWVEVNIDERWVGLEGVICDTPYLDGVRKCVGTPGAFLGYGVGTNDLANPPIAWCGTDTAIQQTGVNNDYGTYDDPDSFYAEYGVNLTGIRGLIYRKVVRPRMNRRVARIRDRNV